MDTNTFHPDRYLLPPKATDRHQILDPSPVFSLLGHFDLSQSFLVQIPTRNTKLTGQQTCIGISSEPRGLPHVFIRMHFYTANIYKYRQPWGHKGNVDYHSLSSLLLSVLVKTSLSVLVTASMKLHNTPAALRTANTYVPISCPCPPPPNAQAPRRTGHRRAAWGCIGT